MNFFGHNRLQDLFRQVSLTGSFLDRGHPLPHLLRLFLMVHHHPQVINAVIIIIIIINIVIVIIIVVIIIAIVIIDFCLHVCWTCYPEKSQLDQHEQPIIVTQKP